MIGYISQAVTYHTSGKIKGLHSLDVSCSNCQFCQKKQAEADLTQICTYCYTGSMWPSAKQAHAITGEILSRLELTSEEAAAVSIPASCAMFRFNSDGELINQTHATNLVRIAATHPETVFSVWTKRPGLLKKPIEEEGHPGNLLIGYSSPDINIDWNIPYFPFIDFVFTVYTPTGIETPIKQGARECNGKKCIDCGFKCYRKQPEIGPRPARVAEVLRRPRNMKKAEFEKLCDLIDQKTL